MKKVKIEPFKIIGIAIKTTNENGQAAKDIGNLWQKLMTENIIEQIPNKINATIYSIYTDYKGDHTKPYTTILGCKVKNFDIIPYGMVSKTIEGAHCAKFTVQGDLSKGMLIFEEWQKIWQLDLDRAYTSDFEVYGEKTQNPKDAEVDIFVAIRSN